MRQLGQRGGGRCSSGVLHQRKRGRFVSVAERCGGVVDETAVPERVTAETWTCVTAKSGARRHLSTRTKMVDEFLHLPIANVTWMLVRNAV